MTHMIFAHVLY